MRSMGKQSERGFPRPEGPDKLRGVKRLAWCLLVLAAVLCQGMGSALAACAQPVTTHAWRLNGAGRSGGLLARTDANGSTFYHNDGGGNVTALMDGDENMAARYLYNTFGKVLGQWGLMASTNEMRFSSMPVHIVSGMPGNNPVNKIDPYGLILPELLEEAQIFWEEDGPAIEAEGGALAEEASAEAETLWSKTADWFSKTRQSVLNQGLGRSAENATCPLKNRTSIPSLNCTAKFRIPDLLDPAAKLIGDTKKMPYISMTPQLQDFIDYANQMGYQFQPTVPFGATLSSSVENAVPLVIYRQLP